MTDYFTIGPHKVSGRAVLAPMAGLTDQVFRNLCRNFGAALAISEMNTSDTRLWNSVKSHTRLNFSNENGLKVLQIAGSQPSQMADAAQAAQQLGADIVDINMGCPAKKVCRKLSGSALLQDEKLVTAILSAVTAATTLPVTLKMRTGWNPHNRNGVKIAKIAEASGIQALAIHGRTRACMFKGAVEFKTIRDIKAAVSIPVIANGDIDSVQMALEVLNYTRANAVMIGRGALGQPWVFRTLNRSLDSNKFSASSHDANIDLELRRDTILSHLSALHDLYGEARGVRVARKHLSWYCKYLDDAENFWREVAQADHAADQLEITKNFFDLIQNPKGGDCNAQSLAWRLHPFQKEYAEFKTQRQQEWPTDKNRSHGPQSQSAA